MELATVSLDKRRDHARQAFLQQAARLHIAKTQERTPVAEPARKLQAPGMALTPNGSLKRQGDRAAAVAVAEDRQARLKREIAQRLDTSTTRFTKKDLDRAG